MFGLLRYIWIMLATIFGVHMLAGCALPANPHTEISVNPAWHTISVYNNKDVNVSMKNVKATWTNGSLEFDELSFDDNASSVRRANVEQMKAYTDEINAMGQQMIGLAAQVNQLATSLMPMLNTLAGRLPPATSLGITTPLGTIERTSVPASQPVHP